MTTPAAPADPPRRRVDLATGPAAYSDEGSGPVLVALHGLPGSLRDFRWLAAALPADVRLVRLDLAGFGETPRSTAPGVTLEERAALAVNVIRALGVERCVVMGHSMGGPVAVAVATQLPAVVMGVALLASVGLRPHKAFRSLGPRALWGQAMDWPVAGPVLQRVMRRALLATGFPPSTPVTEVAQTMRMVGAFDFGSAARNARALRCSVLGAYARDDTFIEPAITEELFAAVPAGPRLWFDRGGHNIQKSHAVEIAAELAPFVRACALKAPVEPASAL